MVSQSLMETNDSNIAAAAGQSALLMGEAGNSENGSQSLITTTPSTTASTSKADNKPNLSALLENSTDAQFPDNYEGSSK